MPGCGTESSEYRIRRAYLTGWCLFRYTCVDDFPSRCLYTDMRYRFLNLLYVAEPQGILEYRHLNFFCRRRVHRRACV